MLNIERHWYGSGCRFFNLLLLPLAWIFYFVVMLRYRLYRMGIKKTVCFPVPVIVVGNITVGGTGKTPFVIWLTRYLKTRGYRPGIVSRGYGGKSARMPVRVEVNSVPQKVGDEAILLARHGQCPVVVGIDRVAAVDFLLKHTDCNIVVSDDGLQHYRLARDIEIALVDGERRFGNGYMLPAGPLREPIPRLKKVDCVIAQQRALQNEYQMLLVGKKLVSVNNREQICELEHFKNKRVHALAGIGNPERFFLLLRTHGLDIIEHHFPDHHFYKAQDIQFNDVLPVIMTEKDAVKCHDFATAQHWYLPVEANVDEKLKEVLLDKLRIVKDCSTEK